MTDPFEHIRAQLGPVDEDNANLCEGCVRDLLTDADALLAVKEEAEELRLAMQALLGDWNADAILRRYNRLNDVIVALPKHLRSSK